MVKGMVPYKVGGWDTDFSSVRNVINGTVHRLCGEVVPEGVLARIGDLELSLEQAERDFTLLVKAMESQGITFSDDD